MYKTFTPQQQVVIEDIQAALSSELGGFSGILSAAETERLNDFFISRGWRPFRSGSGATRFPLYGSTGEAKTMWQGYEIDCDGGPIRYNFETAPTDEELASLGRIAA